MELEFCAWQRRMGRPDKDPTSCALSAFTVARLHIDIQSAMLMAMQACIIGSTIRKHMTPGDPPLVRPVNHPQPVPTRSKSRKPSCETLTAPRSSPPDSSEVPGYQAPGDRQ